MAQIQFKGSAVHTNGELPSVGSQAIDFRLVDVDLNQRSLADFKGVRKLLYTVPSLDTSVCFRSTKTFYDRVKTHPQVRVLVISADLPFAQKRVVCCGENQANVATLSMMQDRRFAQDYGVLLIDGPLAGLAARSFIVLDEADRIVYAELVPEITQEPNYDKAMQMLLGPTK